MKYIFITIRTNASWYFYKLLIFGEKKNFFSNKFFLLFIFKNFPSFNECKLKKSKFEHYLYGLQNLSEWLFIKHKIFNN